MPLSLADYAESLDARDLIWPQVPPPVPVKAKPAIDPIPGVKAVLWDLYGTLLRTADGEFTLFPEPEVRLQVALEKTIHEFNMWNSMYRKPGPPWQSMIQQYKDYAERISMIGTTHKGDFTEVNLVDIWRAIVDRLFDKEYEYDRDLLGNEDALSEKIAWFFHGNLQATEARDGAASALSQLADLGIRQGLLADAQPFSMLQLERSLKQQGLEYPLPRVISPEYSMLSTRLGIRKPSKSLFDQIIGKLHGHGIEVHEILHVSCRLDPDLKAAKASGMKTALLAAEKTGLKASGKMLKSEETRPDRLMTDITQISDVVGFD